ncbi:unnamed protein product [Rotaria sordida]|uniref:Major facilitator superfamily (MFS) profile domain-containing protein n=1 Tax=Rotaria sordida TaxID=392033 RepID=A0A814H6R9_9BILA|nr:unnamed protein product [Rotaria sordida]
MSTNNINSQQPLAQLASNDRLENDDNETSKQKQSSSSSSPLIEINSNNESPTTSINNYENLDKNSQYNIHALTPAQQRERTGTLIVIGLIAFLIGVDYAIILPTAWGYLNSFGELKHSGLVIGGLLAAFALSSSIAGLIFGHLSDIGYSLKQIAIICIGFKIIGNLLYFIGINFYVVIIARLIAGIGMGLVPPTLAEISRRSTSETRTQLLAKILACRQIGLFVGPCFTLICGHMNFTLFGLNVTIYNSPGLLMAILWIITLILTIFFFFDAPKTINEEKSSSEGCNRNSLAFVCKRISSTCRKPTIIVLLITAFIAYFNQTALETALTPFTNIQFGWHELEVSVLFAIAGIEITLVYVILHFVTKKIHDEAILLFAYIILSIACSIGVIILPFSEVGSDKYLPVFLLFVGLDIFALPLIAVTTTSLFTQQTHNDQQGIGQGIQRFVINVATIIGPLFAGSLLKATWLMISFMFIIVLIATLLVTLVYPSFSLSNNDELSALIPPENKK